MIDGSWRRIGRAKRSAPLRMLVLAGAASLLLAACSQGDDRQATDEPAASDRAATTQAPSPGSDAGHGWGDAVREQFIESCTVSSGGQDDYCRCAAEFSEKAYPNMAEFAAKLSSGDPKMAEFLQKKLIAACGDKIRQR